MNKGLSKSTSSKTDSNGIKRIPLISDSEHDDIESELRTSNKEKTGISNIKRRQYGDQDKFIDSPITNAYATSAVHANSLRTGAFVDYDNVGETTYSRKTKTKKIVTGRSRSNSQASISTAASTPRRAVTFKPTPKNKKTVIITKKSRKQERSLNSVYDNKTYKVQRKASILKKMESMEKKMVEEYNRNLDETERKLRESTLQQRQALKKVDME